MPVTVFLVEDDPDVRQYVEQTIRSDAGMHLAGTAGNVTEADRKLRYSRVDVLIVDIGLPDGSGIDVIRKARDGGVSDSILVFSVLGDEQPVLAAIDAGAHGYLLKGGLPAELLRAIREVASGFAPISPSIARHLLAQLRGPGPKGPVPPPGPPPPSPPKHPRFPDLTPTEEKILDLLSQGYTHKEVARLIGMAPSTVSTHVRNIYKKNGGRLGRTSGEKTA